MAEKKFANGFIMKRPNENAPSFVKGKLSLKADEAIAFIQSEAKNGWVNLDLLESKDKSKLYFVVNDYKPENKERTIASLSGKSEDEKNRLADLAAQEDNGDPAPEDIPF